MSSGAVVAGEKDRDRPWYLQAPPMMVEDWPITLDRVRAEMVGMARRLKGRSVLL